MALLQLQHYTLRTVDMEKTRNFYETVLGLPVGDRPDLGFHGYWHYCAGQPVVHLVPPGNHIGAGISADSGNLDHVAFLATDYEGTKQHLRDLGIAFNERDQMGATFSQLFIRDPDEVMVELNFIKAG